MIELTPSFHCDLCQSQDTEVVYVPDGTVRESKVCLCLNCGCLFSIQTKPTALLPPSISHLASYGGIRINKGTRSRANLEMIAAAFGPEARPDRVLDVGASRGAFIRELLDWSPHSIVDAIEPNKELFPLELYTRHCNVIGARVEDVKPPKGLYTLVVMSHTLEHLLSPRAVLLQLREALAPDGWLFVEVPDMGTIMGYEDGLEECFLDRHLFHFSEPTLRTLLETAGFMVKYLERDGENISVVAFKVPDFFIGDLPYNPRIVSETKTLLETYRTTRARNLALLPDIAGTWNQIAREKRVVVWGIGRLFSALVVAGLKTQRLVGMVDKNYPYLSVLKYHYVVCSPDRLPAMAPDLIMACSRTSQAEIKAQARELLGTETEVLGWDEV